MKHSGNGFKKQRNNNFTKNIIVFLLNNVSWANRKGETTLYFLSFGRITIVHQRNKNILDDILVLLFFVVQIRSLVKI